MSSGPSGTPFLHRTEAGGRRQSLLLAGPALAWFLGLLLIPLGFVVLYSFLKRGVYGELVFAPTIENYTRVADLLYLRIFWSSLKLALVTVFSCLAVGFPMAYAMATAPRKLRSVLLVLVMLPFWTNFIVRTYALKVFLSETGPVNEAALTLGLLKEPFVFSNTLFAVWLGMLTNYLPFMVLPLYVAIEKFDFGLIEAARDLGASHSQALRKILVPMVAPGMAAGSIFVFTPALGEFVIPDLLGGAKVMLFGNVVAEQFLKSRDWPFGSALSILLILTVMASLVVYLRHATGGESLGRRA